MNSSRRLENSSFKSLPADHAQLTDERANVSVIELEDIAGRNS